MDKATAQTHLDDSLTQLAAARKSSAYGINDVNVSRQTIEELQKQVDGWQRIVDSYTAAASGVTNTMASVPNFR